MAVTVIIPAYNEAARLPGVLRAVSLATLVREVLVIDDGSSDETGVVAHRLGATVLRLAQNQGKGAAMHAGALAARDDHLLFLDADLRGLTPAHVDALIRPVLAREVAMTVGIFHGGRLSTDLAQYLSPHISGQRCLARAIFLDVPGLAASRSGAEIALTAYVRARRLPYRLVQLAGVTHVIKEEKLGLVHGLYSRWRMYCDIVKMLARCLRPVDRPAG